MYSGEISIVELLVAEFDNENDAFDNHVRDAAKVQVIRDSPLPKSHRKLREFLGLVNFYRRFLPHAADLLYPLTQLLGNSNSGTKDHTVSSVSFWGW